MMRWLCFFFPHQWWHIKLGIWQCHRCKELSIGHDLNDDYDSEVYRDMLAAMEFPSHD